MSDQEGCDISTNQSQGCPVPVGNTICGEANSLEIMKEFNRLYEERMEQVDSEAGGDCLQEKMKLQQEWIKNLTQQNDMLVRAVQELEYEATERVRQLEDKLHKSAQCLCEVMKKYREHDFTVDLLAEPLQKISRLEDDVMNVVEFVRRVRESEEWSTDGLFFYNITKEDLLGTKSKYSNKLTNDGANEGEKVLQEKERTVQELTQRVNYFNSFGDLEGMAKELKVRREECESLKQVLTDSRQALTEEVALKHDEVIMLRKDLKVLEDRCLQADKQTAFKEDIIRELRKEIKQLKQQVSLPEKPHKLSKSNTAQTESHNLSQSKVSKEQQRSKAEHPYLIVHSSKKQAGRNTVIYINKDGSVHKETNCTELAGGKNRSNITSKEHTDICSKCKNKFLSRKSFFPACKSENDLNNIKSQLKPVKDRSKLTNSTFSRCKTFVDRTKHVLNEIEFEERFCGETSNSIPVKLHVDYLERKKY